MSILSLDDCAPNDPGLEAAEALASVAEGLDVGLLVCNHLMPLQRGRFLDADPTLYRDEIGIRSEGLPAVITRFRGTAVSEGRLAADRLAEPMHFDAFYDLRKRLRNASRC